MCGLYGSRGHQQDPVATVDQPPLQLVAEHERFVVVSKAAGVSFHQEDGQPGVAALARELVAGPLHTLHRLDKVTSGLLLLARDAGSARELGQAFAEHRIEKRYLALASRPAHKKQGWIRGGMEKGRNGSWRLTRSRELEAITWFVSSGLGSMAAGLSLDGVADATLRLFLLRPYSGRTHQLRVAMKSLGSPIVGDSLYGGCRAARTFLHAWQLAFELDGAAHRFIAPPPGAGLFALPRVHEVLQVWQDMVLPTPPQAWRPPAAAVE